MRYPAAVHLSAPTTELGERAEPVATAVAAGAVTEAVAAKYGYAELRVSELPPVDLATRAARSALAASGVDPAELAQVLHAWTYFQGHDFWSPAHYVAAKVGADQAVPVGVQQMCNGGITAVETAARHLVADPSAGPVLVTTGDRFAPPRFDRWGGDLGVCYGDGATAVLVTREPRGPSVRLLASRTIAAANLEAMHRGDLPFGSAPATEPLRPGLTKRQFAAGPDAVDLAKVAHTALLDVLTGSLADAGVAPDRVAAVALPRLSRNGLDDVYRPAFEDCGVGPALDFGTRTGHLGAGDPVANLTSLLADAPARGSVFVLIGAGAGFTWTSAVVEVV